MAGHGERAGEAGRGIVGGDTTARSTAGPETAAPSAGTDRSLLVVDDDAPFSTRLARAMQGSGYETEIAHTFADGASAIEWRPPAFAVIDMRLGDGNGLDLIARLKACRPDARAVILTGYANIATAVTAVKLGAFDYLAKPADADEIHGALTALQGERSDPPKNPMSAHRVRWEHIQRFYELNGRNTTRTARCIGMSRRALQDALKKRAPR